MSNTKQTPPPAAGEPPMGPNNPPRFDILYRHIQQARQTNFSNAAIPSTLGRAINCGRGLESLLRPLGIPEGYSANFSLFHAEMRETLWPSERGGVHGRPVAACMWDRRL